MTLVARAVVRVQDRLFIDGEFVDALDGATFSTIDPHDGSVIAEVAPSRASTNSPSMNRRSWARTSARDTRVISGPRETGVRSA